MKLPTPDAILEQDCQYDQIQTDTNAGYGFCSSGCRLVNFP